MARIRTIKPEFFTSDDICALEPYARLLYIGLWCEADREGRFEWKPTAFKRRYLPDDSIAIENLCQKLIASGLVVLYGDGLAYIPTFAKHQHINPRESASSLPNPDASSRVIDASSRVSDVQGGREGKGREGKEDASRSRRTSARKTSLPENFSISERVSQWAREKGFTRLSEHLDAFKAKVKANGYAYVDWDAAFMEAIRNDWARLGQQGVHGMAPGAQKRRKQLGEGSSTDYGLPGLGGQS